MGCVKSKKSDAASHNGRSEKSDVKSKGERGETAYLVRSAESCPQANPALLDYAQKLSEEIVSRAVRQWVEIDSRYSDIPYIECDAP